MFMTYSLNLLKTKVYVSTVQYNTEQQRTTVHCSLYKVTRLLYMED